MKRSSVSSSVESANRSSNGEVTNNINADQGGSATGGNTINKNKSNNTTKHRATTNKIFSGGNTRLRRRQKRSGMYRKQQAVKALQKKVVNYDLGAAELATSLMPTNEEITRAVDKEYNASKKGALADKFRSSASKIAAAQKKASKIIEAMLKDWDEGGHTSSLMESFESYGKIGTASNTLQRRIIIGFGLLKKFGSTGMLT